MFLDLVHTQGPLDGSLYAKVRKKDSVEGAVKANGLSPSAVEHTSPVIDHALSVSSDSGNSTASIKTDRTDEVAAGPQTSSSTVSQKVPVPVVEESPKGHRLTPPAQQPISQAEKQELEQLLSGLEGPMHQQGYLSTTASTARGMLHLVPAQVHVNGHGTVDRETDILDDELPTSQEGNSVDSLGTFSSIDGRATPADIYYQSESLTNGQDHVPYLECSGPEKRQVTHVDKRLPLTQSDLDISSVTYSDQPNGSLYRSLSLGGEPKCLPQAPARTTSSRNAVQRGLNVWQRFGVPEEPVFDEITFSPPSVATMTNYHRPLQFPHGDSASQQEIEQSIETLNLLMLDLEPGCPPVPKSQSAPLQDNGAVVTTQPSFSQSQTRPSYQGSVASNSHVFGPASGPVRYSSPAQMSQDKVDFPNDASETTAADPPLQRLPVVAAQNQVQLRPSNTYPSSLSQVDEPQRSHSTLSGSPQPRTSESSDVFNVEGLVLQRLAGKI